MSHFLVVDDSKVVRTVARKILEELGFSVTEAENGQQALSLCKQTVPDGVLLDWNMPVMDGMEFLLAFRQLKEHAHTKVVFCTTENDMEKIAKALENGADEYVMKPFDASILRDKLQQVGLLP